MSCFEGLVLSVNFLSDTLERYGSGTGNKINAYREAKA